MPITLPVGICSSAFSWRFPNLTDGMLTAGHCAHTGGQVSTPDDPIGTVVATDFENWRVGFGNGTRILPGDNIYRGDLALVQNHTLAKHRRTGSTVGGPQAVPALK